MNKDKPCENPCNLAGNQDFELFTSRHFKNLISPKPMEQSVVYSVNKFKAIASIVKCPCYAHISDFFKKKDFSENLVNLGMGI